jgi:hypothetical protein
MQTSATTSNLIFVSQAEATKNNSFSLHKLLGADVTRGKRLSALVVVSFRRLNVRR